MAWGFESPLAHHLEIQGIGEVKPPTGNQGGNNGVCVCMLIRLGSGGNVRHDCSIDLCGCGPAVPWSMACRCREEVAPHGVTHHYWGDAVDGGWGVGWLHDGQVFGSDGREPSSR